MGPRAVVAASCLLAVVGSACRRTGDATATAPKPAAVPDDAEIGGSAPSVLTFDDLVMADLDGASASMVIADQGALDEGEDRWDGPVPFELGGLPAEAQRGARWWLVTAQGRTSAEVIAIAAEPLVYDDALRVTVRLAEPLDAKAGGFGLAAPGQMPSSPTPRLVPIAYWGDLPRAVVLAEAEVRATEVEDFARCKPTLEAIRGRFPPGQHAMVRVDLDCPGDEFGAWGEVWMVDERGEYVADTQLPDYNDYEFLALVDLDADGIDEVVVAASYYEGSSQHLAHWTGATWNEVTLGGDGA
ncbi:MAG TPA: hypothetical protein VFG69_17500 [Nannocystaceae bacterium]|nr:hypothetical protein [Nannocystaceae bacterium]